MTAGVWSQTGRHRSCFRWSGRSSILQLMTGQSPQQTCSFCAACARSVDCAATAKISVSQRSVKTGRSSNLQRSNDGQGSRCGQNRHLLTQLSLAQKLLASAASGLWKHSEISVSGHSMTLTSPKSKRILMVSASSDLASTSRNSTPTGTPITDASSSDILVRNRV